MKLIKTLTLLGFLASFASILFGYIFDSSYSQKLIGFGVVGLFFVVFPAFSYYRWKGKNLRDYMLTPENLEKMRDNEN